jgi:hypothetical protein
MKLSFGTLSSSNNQIIKRLINKILKSESFKIKVRYNKEKKLEL